MRQGTHIPTGAYGAYQPSYDKFELPLDAMLEAVNAAGLVPGQDVMIGVDCAAHELFDYVSFVHCFWCLWQTEQKLLRNLSYITSVEPR